MIKNIIFDIGNVLVHFRPKEVITQDLGISAERAVPLLEATVRSPLWAELDRGARPEEEVLAQMRGNVPEDLRADFDRFITEGKEHLVRPCPYAVEWLSGLRARGFCVYLLSNYPVSYFEAHQKNFPFLPYINGKIVSGYVKLLKPEPEIYRLLLDTYGLKPGECIFLDDLPANAAAAAGLGIHGIVFRDYGTACAQIEELIRACR